MSGTEGFFDGLTAAQRKEMSMSALGGKELQPPCPFRRPVPGRTQTCTKKGGVCSLQMYESEDGAEGHVPDDHRGLLRTVCPYRFEEANIVLQWVSNVLLGTSALLEIAEVGFLRPQGNGDNNSIDDVGRIDLVLVHPNLDPLRWCAVEMQAVYFSGKE